MRGFFEEYEPQNQCFSFMTEEEDFGSSTCAKTKKRQSTTQTTTTIMRRTIVVASGALWLSLVTCLVSSLSTQPYNENSRGQARPASPVASPETMPANRQQQQQRGEFQWMGRRT
jgi:hypothetical protein